MTNPLGATTVIGYDALNRQSLVEEADGATSRVVYDEVGNITEITDPLGNTTKREYDLANQLIKVTDPLGNETKMTYTALGQVECVINANGNKHTYAYYPGGKLKSVCLPCGETEMYDYNRNGNIKTVTDALGNVTTLTYDSLDRMITTTNPLGYNKHFTYDAAGNITQITDESGNIIKYSFYVNGKLKSVTLPNGEIETCSYDLMGNLISFIDVQGNKTTLEYNNLRRLVKTTNSLGQSKHFKYDAAGNIIQVTDENNYNTNYTYYTNNKLRSVTLPSGETKNFTYDPNHNLTSITDSNGSISTLEYDNLNRLIKSTNPLGHSKRFAYDVVGNITLAEDEGGNITKYAYYANGKVQSVTLPCGETENYEYDLKGNLTQVTDAFGHKSVLTYDCLNRVIKSTNPLGHSKHFAYDAVGNITHITDENGSTTMYKYSPLGKVVEAVDPLGSITQYSYDSKNHLTELTRYNKLGEPQITTYQRNAKGEVIAVTSPLGEMVKYTYDAMGNVIVKQDEDTITLYTYNCANQLAKTSYADGKTVELEYNALNQLIRMKDFLGVTSIERNLLGQATKVTDHNGNEVGYDYDATGKRKHISYPNGKEVSYEYTPSGKLSKVLDGKSITAYTYDATGKLTNCLLPDNTTTTYEYNTLGVLTGLSHSKNGDILDKFNYTHDPVGNIIQIEKSRAGAAQDSGVFEYTYDPLSRLTEAVKTSNGTTISKQYHYDSLGNRISGIQNGVETRHSFNARNQLIQTTEGSDITDYTYDKRGNLTQVALNGQLQTSYVYDAANLMTEAHSPTKGSAVYTYNGFRKRVAMLENMVQTNYVLDATLPYDNLLMTEGNVNQMFAWGHSLISVSDTLMEETTKHFYLHDHLGSPIRLINNTNAEGEAMSYDEFGVPEITAGVYQPFGFTGYQTDTVSNLQYAQARYYSPQAARFVAEDTMRDGRNYYMHCRANPLSFIDKNGLWGKEYHEDVTKEEAYELGFCSTSIDQLAYAVRWVDEHISGYNFMPLIGNQAIHFNRFDPDDPRGDSREYYGNQYRERAAAAWVTAMDYHNLLSDIPTMDFSDMNIGLQGSALIDRVMSDTASLRDSYFELAMNYLGIALHAHQDISAHGQIGAGSTMPDEVIIAYILKSLAVPGFAVPATPVFAVYAWQSRGHTIESVLNNNTVQSVFNSFSDKVVDFQVRVQTGAQLAVYGAASAAIQNEGLLLMLGRAAASFLIGTRFGGSDVIDPADTWWNVWMPTLPNLGDPDSRNYEWGDITQTWLVRALDPENNARFNDMRDATNGVLVAFIADLYRKGGITSLYRPTCTDGSSTANNENGGSGGSSRGGGNGSGGDPWAPIAEPF